MECSWSECWRWRKIVARVVLSAWYAILTFLWNIYTFTHDRPGYLYCQCRRYMTFYVGFKAFCRQKCHFSFVKKCTCYKIYQKSWIFSFLCEDFCNIFVNHNFDGVVSHSCCCVYYLVLLRIPSSHLNLRTLPQFVRIRGFSATVNDGFETISRRPEIKWYRAQMHVARRTAIINVTTVIARHTSLKCSAHPQRLQYTLIERQTRQLRWA